jgi:hypothetical protein
MTRDAQWRARRFGYFTGTATLRWLRSELRYLWARHTWLTRFIFTRLAPREIYEFVHDEADPLTFHLPNGTELRPKDRMETDMGSVPRILGWIIEKDQYLNSFFMHDSAYEDAGLEMRTPVRLMGRRPEWLPQESDICLSYCWTFYPMTRPQVEGMLWTMTGAQGALAAQRDAIWAAVRAAGWLVWSGRSKKRENLSQSAQRTQR